MQKEKIKDEIEHRQTKRNETEKWDYKKKKERMVSTGLEKRFV